LVARSWFIQGGILILFVEGAKTPGRPAYPRLQLVEGRLCATPPDLRDREGESIIDGCQVDGRGRTIGYYIADEDSKGRKIFSGPRPADTVIHVFEPSRAGQYRELSLLHAVMNELRDLDDLHVLEMIACKDAAEKSNIVTNAAGELNAASLIRQRASATQQTVTGSDSTADRAEYISLALGGRTIAMKTGETYAQFKSERPSVASREYWNYKTELVCNGVGIPMCMAFPNTAIQGTALRAALDMAATFFQQRFAVIADVCRRIYVRNMDWARYNEPTLRDAPADWANVIIHAPRAPNVDVGYNSAAALAELSVGACNFSMIYGPRGLDWREQMDALNEQLTYADSIGLTERLAAMNAAQKAVPDPEDQLEAATAQPEAEETKPEET
jgi:capsid protein